MGLLNLYIDDGDLVIAKGAAFSQSFEVLDVNDDPVDLSSYTITSLAKRAPGGATVITFTVDTSQAASGIIALTLTAVTTAALTDDELLYDIKFNDGSADFYWAEGKVYICTPITT